jgi:hypothetical protein
VGSTLKSAFKTYIKRSRSIFDVEGKI